jgi:hypothetical protein
VKELVVSDDLANTKPEMSLRISGGLENRSGLFCGWNTRLTPVQAEYSRRFSGFPDRLSE